jgi:hypothetical protein
MRAAFILIVSHILCLSFGFSQIELKDANVLVIGYDNVLRTSEAATLKFPNPLKGQPTINSWGEEEITPDFYGAEVVLKSHITGLLSNNEIIGIQHSGEYTIVPDHNYFKDGDSLIIEFYSLNSESLISSRTYVLRSLPKPNIYWGVTGPGERVIYTNNRLFVKYGADISLNSAFQIANYSVKIGDKSYSGLGATINTDIIEVIKKLKKGSNTEIEIKVVYFSKHNQVFETSDKFIY